MKDIILIKMGGKFTADEENLLNLAAEMKSLADRYVFVIIHGGGAEITDLTRKFGIEPVFKDGVRITTSEEMKFVDKVLSGKINKRLVRIFQKADFDAVGLTGSDGKIFTGTSVNEGLDNPSHTGSIKKVNTRLLEILLRENFLPVIGSTSMDDKGMALNINADDVGFLLAAHLKCSLAIFLSDIPGILKGKEVIQSITPQKIAEEITAGVITGGMIPKVKSVVDALSAGVKKVIIGQYLNKGSLVQLLNGTIGTIITNKE